MLLYNRQAQSYTTVMKKDCFIEGCKKYTVAKGLCGLHYQRLKRHGDVNRNDRTKYTSNVCEEDCCKSKRWAGPFCMKHYYRYKRHGKNFSSRKMGHGTVCTNCKNRKYKTMGLCNACYGRLVHRKSKAYKINQDRQKGTIELKVKIQKIGARRRHWKKNVDITKEFLIYLWCSTSICEICKKEMDNNRHLDHIVPLNPLGGGKHERSNVCYLHPYCNMSRPHDGSDMI